MAANDQKKDNPMEIVPENLEVAPEWARSLHTKLDLVLTEVSSIHNTISVMKDDISHLKHKVEVNEVRMDDVENRNDNLLEDHEQISKKVDTLLGRVLRIETKQNTDHESILDLKCRSMRNNIVFAEIPGDIFGETNDMVENKIYEFIEQKCGIQNPKQHIHIERAHRMGVRSGSKPRVIVARFFGSKDKDKIMECKKKNKDLKIFDQFPDEIRERRRQLGPVLVKAREKQAKAKLVVDKLIINGNIHRNENIPRIPVASDLFSKDVGITDAEIFSSLPRFIKGNKFQGHIVHVSSLSDVRNVIDQYHRNARNAMATHSSYAFRLENRTSQTERYDDDGEYGAGEYILRELRNANLNNTLLIVSRWASHEKLGFARFSTIQDSSRDAIELLAQLN